MAVLAHLNRGLVWFHIRVNNWKSKVDLKSQLHPAEIGYQEEGHWKVTVASSILTTSLTVCQLVYKNYVFFKG